MKKNKFIYIIIFISITIFATVSLQIYWNLKNYHENKIRVINEVQMAFDRAIDSYYIEESKKNTVAYFARNGNKLNVNDLKFDSLLGNYSRKVNIKQKYSSITNSSNKILVSKANVSYSGFAEKIPLDTLKKNDLQNINVNQIKSIVINRQQPKYKIYRGKKTIDSVTSLNNTLEKMVFSITSSVDSINFNIMTTFFEKELNRKNIVVDYQIQHFKFEKIVSNFRTSEKPVFTLKTETKSNYLPNNEKLQLLYTDPTLLILKLSLTGIILSLLLSFSIIGCLIYLFRIINKQKKIDVVKNDLISNITHEFKTPITTIASAIEGIKNFNAQNDAEKTSRYLNISEHQIQKLSSMVEKLLETASLSTDQLELKKEPLDLVILLQSNIEKHQFFCPSKSFYLDCNFKQLMVYIDAFHFENAVSNLLDNAIKYGGYEIEVAIIILKKNIEITFSDNGFGISKEHQDKIFDQFYRISKGNIHDVKGFGIGLYYSKKIIEKHGGTLLLNPNSKTTTFKITLPHE